MRWVRRLSRSLSQVALAAITSACADGLRQQPSQMENCMYLHSLWRRYEYHMALHTGQGARGEHAVDDCSHNRFDAGIPELERMLRRGRLPPQFIAAKSRSQIHAELTP